ncbi:two-component sensor histidine kinase [Streptomyces chrestomyceticus JCM 4735]|uniref:Sensor-like histidine kinase SenX3 n=1 Tax=Streptomyces chrestomyceticus JCM 4735 TaxID=1306181 RepID=A0A7U9PWM1_9ACTN|nr:HAMP domain-containing sensor histidine kinase [Streptomyces chrestomyceticus]GCD33535.1 two-component sensor histidine kinase [Streptomyces chrestomyceticus JCM 4735]
MKRPRSAGRPRRGTLTRSLPRGLRARLVVAFLLVAAVSALTTAALTYREARNAILQRSQDTAIKDLRGQVNSLAPDLAVPPTRADVDEFSRQLDRSGKARDWDVYVQYKGLAENDRSQLRNPVIVPAELRESVETRHVTAFQRVDRDGEPWLLIGMPVMQSQTETRTASPLSVYAQLPLRAEEANVEALVSAAQRGALPVLGLAVVPALLAARGVLRPVRGLRQAAGRIAEGKLETRLEVKGADELADLSRTFNDMAAKLEESVADLRRMEANARRFAADVSHELRTPLAAMTAVTDVLDEDADALDPDTASAVRLISQETGKLARMVEDLMEVSRFDAGAAALHLDEVDVAETIRKTLQARAWQGRVCTELPDGVRARLDPRRLDVVVANLVGNALHHGGEPVRVLLRAPEPGDGRLVIRIVDSGPGIDPEVLPHVFDRFYKADSARARSEGSGLGLAIAMENVRLHGGTMRAANCPDGGAVFTVELPLPEQETGTAAGPPEAAGETGRAPADENGPADTDGGQDTAGGGDHPAKSQAAAPAGKADQT